MFILRRFEPVSLDEFQTSLSCIINSYLPFFFCFFYDNVIAIRCMLWFKFVFGLIFFKQVIFKFFIVSYLLS